MSNRPTADLTSLHPTPRLFTRALRRVPTLAGALAVTAGLNVALTAKVHAQVDAPRDSAPTAAAPATAEAALTQATALLKADKAVRARALLVPLATQASLSDAQRTQARDLLEQADRKISSLNPATASLQKAELAVEQGELMVAERHLRGIARDRSAGRELVAQSESLLGTVKQRQSEIAKTAPDTLNQVVRSFAEGRFDQSRSLLDRLVKSGAPLNAAERDTVEEYQNKLVDARWEQARAAAAMLQPGVVKPRNPDQPADAAPASEPAPAPASEPAAASADAAAAAPAESGMTSGTMAMASPGYAQPADAQPANGQSPASDPAAAPAAQPADVVPAPAASSPAAPAEPASTDPVQLARQYEAGALLAEAENAYQNSRMNEAQAKYSRLLSQYRQFLTADQVTQAEGRLSEARIMLGAPSGPQDSALQDFGAARVQQKQIVIAEFNNQVSRAGAAIDSGDPSQANQLAAQARLTLNNGREYMSEAEFQQFSQQIRDLQARIDARSTELAAESARTADESRRREAQNVATAAAQERARKIRENIDRVRALQMEMRYEEALQVVDQILFLDPINPTGLLLRDVMTQTLLYQRYNNAVERKQTSMAQLRVEAQEALYGPSEIIDYPPDWPNIIKDRGEPDALAEAPATRAALAQLEKTSRPVDFNDVTIETALGWVKNITQLSMDIDWPSLERVGITKDSPVTVNLSSVRMNTLLSLLMEKVSTDPTNGGAWEVQDGVIRVASAEDINRNTLMVIYDINDLLIEAPDYTNVPEFDLSSATQSNTGGGGGGTSPFTGGNDAQDTNQRTREDLTDEIIQIITESVDPDGWRETGGNVGFIQQFRGNLIITNTPKNHRAIGGLLRRLREIRNMQISVETRFLLVTQEFFEQVGFDLDVYFGGNSANYRAMNAIDPSLDLREWYQQTRPNATTPGPNNVTGGGFIVDSDGDGIPDAPLVQPNFVPGELTGDSWSPVGAQQGSLGITDTLIGESLFASNVKSAGPALSIGGTFLDDIQVDFLVEATQADRRAVSLQAPRLTFTNGQTANVLISEQRAYTADLTPVVSEGAVAFDPQPGILNIGVRLLVQGVISSDRRYVTMNVQTSISDLIALTPFTQNAAVAGVGGNGPGAGVIATGTFQQPTTRVSQVNTTVTIPDQGTVMLGGQRLVDELEVESGVPVLSKIPILNRFFSNRATTKTERTLLMLMKPTILIQSEQENRANPGLIEALDAGRR